MSKGEQTRQEIVERALALAGEVGLFAHFRSKEALQVEVLQRAIDDFIQDVVVPALRLPRGEPRLRRLFDLHLAWIYGNARSGSCFFMALTHEYDDRPGPVRDLLVQSQRDWYDTIARAARTCVEEGHLRADLDLEQFAYEFVGIGMVFQQVAKLLENPRAEERARAAFEALLARSRP